MVDNTTLNPATKVGGDVIATDDIAGVKHQRVKVQYGVEGSATDVSSATPLPITVATTDLVSVTEANSDDSLLEDKHQLDVLGCLLEETIETNRLLRKILK